LSVVDFAAVRHSSLRDRLEAARDQCIARLLRGASLEPAFLAQIAAITTVIEALDKEPPLPARQGAATALEEGLGVRLQVEDAAVVLAPLAAIRLAGELLDAAGLRLADDLARLRQAGDRQQMPTSPERPG
jgi:hypothetical protein